MESTAQSRQSVRSRRGPAGGLWIAAGISLMVHIIAAAALGFERQIGLKGVSAELQPQPPEPPDPDDEDDTVKPGIDNGRRLAVAWLGFTDPTEHTAPQSETEQAALTPDPGGLTSPAEFERVTQSPPEPELPPIETAPEQVTEPEPIESRAPMPTIPVSPPDAMGDPVPPPAEPNREQPTPVVEQQPSPAATPTSEPATEPTEEPGSAPSPGDSGEADDRFSTPTALQSAVNVVPGRPLAREGLEVKTKYFPIWQNLRISTRPNNPVVRLTFNAQGRAELVEFVVEEGVVYSTGSPRYDETVINGLYTWTAEGKQIDELRGAGPGGSDATASIIMRIIIQ